jgi:DNA-binding HxlR family transcriptional regulator
MQQSKQLRSDCPISFSLDMFGDKWSLLIVRDVLFAGKQTFNEFLRSDEGIARNILADRLIQLEEKGILAKRGHPTDGRKDLYKLTEKGLDLIPIILDMSAWGNKHKAGTDPRQFDLGTIPFTRDEHIAYIKDKAKISHI